MVLTAQVAADEEGLILPVYAKAADLTPAAVAEIARIGAPLKVSAAAGETLEAVAERVCGRKDAIYLGYLKANAPPALRASMTDTELQDGSRLGRSGEIELPHCLRLPGEIQVVPRSIEPLRKGDGSAATRVLQEGLVKEGYLGEASGKYDEATVRAVRDFQAKAGIKVDGKAGESTWAKLATAKDTRDTLGRSTFSSIGYTAGRDSGGNSGGMTGAGYGPGYGNDWSYYGVDQTSLWKKAANNPEITAKLANNNLKLAPTESFGGLSSIPLRADLGNTEIKASRERLAALISPSATISEAGPSASFYLLNTVPNTSDNRCEVGGNAADYPIPVMRTIEVLGRNQERPNRPRLYERTIVVADSGVSGIGTSPFADRFFKWRAFQGADPEEEWKPPTTFAGNRGHGTLVAGAALGTKSLRYVQSLLDPQVRIMARSIVHPVTGLIDARRIGNALSVNAGYAEVYNLSFGGSIGVEPMKRWFKDRWQQLFVVAAGNTAAALGAADHYPALLSKDLTNVVTVTAVGPDGTLAWFSNHGADYVGIAAPGCAIPVYSYDAGAPQSAGRFNERAEHGTSMAAPIVSFAAALLWRYGGDWTPVQIRDRLYASAAVVDAEMLAAANNEKEREKLRARARMVEHGRVLDIPSALAIFDDVVTFAKLEDGESSRGEPPRRAFGTILSPESITCGDQTIERPRLRRIVPRFIDHMGEEKFLVYFSEARADPDDGGERRLAGHSEIKSDLKSATCDPATMAALTFIFRPDGSAAEESYEIGRIRSIVFRK